MNIDYTDYNQNKNDDFKIIEKNKNIYKEDVSSYKND